MEGEVVRIDGLGRGQASDFYGGTEPPLFLGGYLLFQKVIQEGEIGAVVLLRLLDDGIE
jgi:hypothetical protein